MFRLLKKGHCLAPDDQGIKDILTVYDKIALISNEINVDRLWNVDEIDCRQCFVCPGLIDQHVHITGGGGEQGPVSRIPEIQFSELVEAGVTTVVGVLGFDSVTRNIAGLLAKARGLETEGISTFIYTGSYGSPTETLTGRVLTDIVLLDKVIGAGEIALSDYRSFHPSLEDLRVLASEVIAGGMLGGKAGILHLHVGDGREGLASLFRLLDESDFPIGMFVPTHINRNQNVLKQGLKLWEMGGNIDLTAGEMIGQSVADCLAMLSRKDPQLSRITVSSDANGSVPETGSQSAGVGRVDHLINDIRQAVFANGLDFKQVLRTVTINPAQLLKLYPQKGCLAPGSDADLLVLDKKSLSLNCMLAKGQVMVRDQQAVRKGKYE